MVNVRLTLVETWCQDKKLHIQFSYLKRTDMKLEDNSRYEMHTKDFYVNANESMLCDIDII